MIGAQAYENLFQTARPKDAYAFVLDYLGHTYYYIYDSEDLAFFEGTTPFLKHIFEDIEYLEGEYADDIEVIA